MIGKKFNVLNTYVNTFLTKTSENFTNVFYSDMPYDGIEWAKDSYLFDPAKTFYKGKYLSLLTGACGDYRGIKEDEMFYKNSVGLRKSMLANRNYACNAPESLNANYHKFYCGTRFGKNAIDPWYINLNDGRKVKNIPSGIYTDFFRQYNEFYGGDFISWGQSHHTFPSTDIQLSNSFIDSEGNMKSEIDTALSYITIGNPHIMVQDRYNKDFSTESKFIEYITMIKTKAFVPAPIYSIGFWNVQDTAWKNAAIKSYKLAESFKKYKYNQAMSWYANEVPKAMTSLFFTGQNDKNVYNMYKYYSTQTQLEANAINHFMVGDSLLIAPVFTKNSIVKVYLPSGKWKCFSKRCQLNGTTISTSSDTTSTTLSGEITYSYILDYNTTGYQDFPVFVREGEIFIKNEDSTTGTDSNFIYAYLDSKIAEGNYVYYVMPTTYTNYQTATIKKFNLKPVKIDPLVFAKLSDSNNSIFKGLYLFNTTDSTTNLLKTNISSIDTTTTFIGDANKDGVINATSRGALIQNLFVNYNSTNSHMDINNSNSIDLVDLVILNSAL